MTVYVCSLIVDETQTIPGDGEYHLLRFPYGSESYDGHDMHPSEQPDGERSEYPDERSG
ncbi:hypothetical protein [Allosalinactinospora lopnorensis]|uniref:hypothetical protein n=1 Tax=Allosalinactinospora lopnorensis TaxID=1352348 RepID=UPI001F4812BC|nr:hypothetical protein [Allosalinactinospora lopnorensis]